MINNEALMQIRMQKEHVVFNSHLCICGCIMFVFLYQHWYCKHYDVRPKIYSGFIDVPYISAYTTRVVQISFHHKLGEHRLERLQQKRAEQKKCCGSYWLIV